MKCSIHLNEILYWHIATIEWLYDDLSMQIKSFAFDVVPRSCSDDLTDVNKWHQHSGLDEPDKLTYKQGNHHTVSWNYYPLW